MPWFLHVGPDGTQQVEADENPAGRYGWHPSTFIEIDRPGDLAIEEWTEEGWRTRIEPLRTRLLHAVDDRRTAVEKSLTARLAHQRKRDEVMTLSASPDLPVEETPWLDAEAQATGQTIAQVADNVREAMRADEARAAEFEGAAIAAKATIRAATTIAEMTEVFEALGEGIA